MKFGKKFKIHRSVAVDLIGVDVGCIPNETIQTRSWADGTLNNGRNEVE